MILKKYQRHREFFDSKAKGWCNQDLSNKKIENIIGKIPFSKNDVILDIGCGTGSISPIIRKSTSGSSVIIGIDVSLEMLNQGKCNGKNEKYTVIQGLGEELPIKSKSADFILNYCIFPHLIFKELAINEYYRVLKNRGGLFIIHPQGRETTNAVHLSAGEPVSKDVLPQIEEIQEMMQSIRFWLKTAIDRSDLFFIEAYKKD